MLLNDLNSDSKIHAHLIEFDTVHGRWKNKIESSRGIIRVNNFDISLTGYEEKKVLNRDKNIDLVIDCTGSIISSADAHEYFESQIKQVIVSAPVKDEGALNIVYGEFELDFKNANVLHKSFLDISHLNFVHPLVNISDFSL